MPAGTGTKMHGNRELLALLENGYDKAVADEIRKLIKVLDDNEALAAEFDPVADSYAPIPTGRYRRLLKKSGRSAKNTE